ncbi:Uncharacterised protein [Corynebacterium renale]|uniref:antitoxin VbhA family protein n=1 Tax=Corynebacterium renale TaxID=1724 RepID=UPI000DA3676E|nr:antitoxin VbhA family protein [Corynebacterium renale]SQG63666.1 Uncharacterised protein [Corynebacterium renale]STD01459.1 Uncharacterised protein [Corynebacterium renale]
MKRIHSKRQVENILASIEIDTPPLSEETRRQCHRIAAGEITADEAIAAMWKRKARHCNEQ